jgi:hypothetical protein
VLVGLESHEPDLRRHMADAGVDFPLILIAAREVRLTAPLQAVGPFRLEVPGPPPRLIFVDALSSEDEWQRYLTPQLVALMAQGRTTPIGVDELISLVIPWWPMYHRAGQKELCRKVHNVLRLMIDRAWSDDIQLEEPHDRDCGFLRMLRTPAANDPHGVTQGWQRVRRMASRSMGRRERLEQALMEPLFAYEDLGLAAEVVPDRDPDEEFEP